MGYLIFMLTKSTFRCGSSLSFGAKVNYNISWYCLQFSFIFFIQGKVVSFVNFGRYFDISQVQKPDEGYSIFLLKALNSISDHLTSIFPISFFF